jgi:hypothetical protein
MNDPGMSLHILWLLVAVALAFDFMNGFHDAANSIATVVSTRVLRPQWAVAWAAFFNIVAYFAFGVAVAATVGKGIIEPKIVDHFVIFGALIGAIVWNVITWIYGIPSSSSHALIGGLAGAAVAKDGTRALIASGFLKTAAAIVLSPLLGLVLGLTLMVIVAWLFRRTTPRRVDRWFRRLQLLSAAAYSLGTRRQRRAENDGHHLDAVDRSRPRRNEGSAAVLGRGRVLHRDRAGYAVRRLADRQDHGSAHHQAAPGRRILCGDRRRDHTVSRHCAGHPGLDYAHDHRRHRRRRVRSYVVCCALGDSGKYCVGMGTDHPGVGVSGRYGVVAGPVVSVAFSY